MREQRRAHIREHKRSTQMRAQRRAHIGEHAYESKHRSTHMKAHIQEHKGEHTYEPAQPKGTWTCHKSHFVWKFTRKMPDTLSGEHLCMEIYEKKRTWTCHKSDFV